MGGRQVYSTLPPLHLYSITPEQIPSFTSEKPPLLLLQARGILLYLLYSSTPLLLRHIVIVSGFIAFFIALLVLFTFLALIWTAIIKLPTIAVTTYSIVFTIVISSIVVFFVVSGYLNLFDCFGRF